MRLLAICTICGHATPDRVARDALLHLDDSGIGVLSCPAGHTLAVIPASHGYELLFESGLLALVDEYWRESVANIAASLERFLEHFVRVSLAKLGASPETVARFWKSVAAQSERQLGAFLFAHLALTGSSFHLPSWISELRNRVIHKGYTPTRDEALRFAAEMRRIIFCLREKLRELAPAEVTLALRSTISARKRLVPEGTEIALFSTLRAFSAESALDEAFEKELGQVRGIKRAFDRRRFRTDA